VDCKRKKVTKKERVIVVIHFILKSSTNLKDGILIPHQHKAAGVRRKLFDYHAMKKFIKLFILITSLTGQANGQNVNLIIQVNDRLILGGLTQIALVVGNDKNAKRTLVNYVPGNLTLTKEIWDEINSDTSKNIFLYFDYNTYTKGKQKVGNFYAEITRRQLNQPYLILDIYDLRDKKYKHWYQYHTNKDFLAHLTFPGSGLLIRQQ